MIAVVTGANKGIGFEISRQLCFKGYKVFMCGRNIGHLNQSAGLLRGEGHDVETVVLDVRDKSSIENLQALISNSGAQIDALVNNAAILLDRDKTILEIEAEEVLETFKTNSLGPLEITKALLPNIKSGGRVVMLSSSEGIFCGEIRYWAPIYVMSKTALNAFTRQLAPVLKDRGIAINSVCPGWVQTEMGGDSAPRSVSQGAETPVWLATEVPLSETGKFWRDKNPISW